MNKPWTSERLLSGGGSLKTKLLSRRERHGAGRAGCGGGGGLSVFFTTLCVVDLFGVFPIVALPRAVIACGLYGIPLAGLVFALQVYTAVLLGRCWQLARVLQPTIGDKSRYPYAAVAELACGTQARRLVLFLIDATVFGAGVPNLIVASQSLQLFGTKMSDGAMDISFCLWLLVVGLLLCPVMWLGSPKDMKSLAAASVLIVSTAAACTWSCILTDDVTPPPAPRRTLTAYRPQLQDFLAAYGIIAFQGSSTVLKMLASCRAKLSTYERHRALQNRVTLSLQFDIHPTILTIQVDMKDSSQINKAVIWGFLVSGAMFSITASLAAMRYGLDVQSNILQGIPASVPLYVVALLVTLQLCLSSAVGNSALFQHIEDLLAISRDFSFKRCIARSSIVVAAVFLAESVPRFDLVMGLVGSTLTGPLMFVFPPVLFIKLSRMTKEMTPEHIASQACVQHKDSLRLNTLSLSQNGDAVLKQNGDVKCTQDGGAVWQNDEQSNILLNPVNHLHDYKTFQSDDSPRAKESSSPKCGKLDVVMACAVMLFGVTATVAATYSSWLEVINYATFTSPCILNATAAASGYFQP